MKRHHPPVDAWCEVEGSIEKGEKAWQAAFREIQEETGLNLSELWLGDRCAQFYDPSRDRIQVLPVFVGYVPKDARVVLNSEHSDYAWCDLTEAFERVVFPAQRSLLHFIWQEFVERRPHPLLRLENG